VIKWLIDSAEVGVSFGWWVYKISMVLTSFFLFCFSVYMFCES
jgi:hypothetical protein